MAKYYETDGTDDRITVNGGNYTAFEADIMILAREDWHNILGLSGRNINFSSNTLNIAVHADFQTVYVNGVPVTPLTPFIPIGERVLLRGEIKSGVVTGTNACYIFHNSVTQFLQGRVYALRFYRGADYSELAASFGMETETWIDQTGNEVSATIVGGAWGDDGSEPEPIAHEGSGSASAIATAAGAATRQLKSAGSAQAVASSSGAAYIGRSGSGSAQAVGQAAGAATRALRGSGSASAVAQAAGIGTVNGVDPVSHFGSGSATAVAQASGAARRGLYGSGAAQAASQATGTATRALRGAGAATAFTLAAGLAFRGLVGSGSAVAIARAQYIAGDPVVSTLRLRASLPGPITLRGELPTAIRWRARL